MENSDQTGILKRMLLHLACFGMFPMIGFAGDAGALKNVLVIVADDHALEVTRSYGNSLVNTPSIDRLGGEGIVFDRAYCNSPICSASRQSMLTGKYPPATGVNLLFTPFPDEGNTTIAEHLAPLGFRTGLIGKTHWNNWAWGSLYEKGMPNHGFQHLIGAGDYRKFLKKMQPEPVPESGEYWIRKNIDSTDIAEWMNWRALPHPVRDEFSMGTYFANEAVRFMEENRDNRFFLWLAFKEPHHPYYFPVEYRDRYDPDAIQLPEGSPEDDRWIPERFRGLTDEEKRGITAAYYTSTEYLDKNIGRVLDGLHALGLTENTVVVYLSDNGYLLGDHKRFEKHTMWEEAVRQPMIWRVPGDSGVRGERSDALVEYVDVVPTLLEVLGLPALAEAQGSSFRKVLKYPDSEHGEYAFSTYLQDNMAMVCDKRWKYVFHTGSRDLGIGYATGYGPSGIVHRLYDLENDPNEHHSVAHLPANQDVLNRLQQRMLTFFEQTHPHAEQCPEGLTLEGKLVWFCEPRDIGDDQSVDDVPKRVFPNPET